MAGIGYERLSDGELCELLKKEERGAWEFVLEKITDQEKKCRANSRKRSAWGLSIEDDFGRLYDEMVGAKKLWNWAGGSLIGWMRAYVRGYLSRSNPQGDGRFVDIDDGPEGENGEVVLTLGDKIAAQVSGERARDAYGGEDLQVLRHEQWEVAQKCFRELWQGNSIQAYVMLLKLRFHLSSLEIKERLGISSVANVDQLYSRAVKKMREVRMRYGD